MHWEPNHRHCRNVGGARVRTLIHGGLTDSGFVVADGRLPKNARYGFGYSCLKRFLIQRMKVAWPDDPVWPPLLPHIVLSKKKTLDFDFSRRRDRGPNPPRRRDHPVTEPVSAQAGNGNF
jgi:hypothetical protein